MNGILVVDKPAGWTSHDVVARVRKILGERSVGHLGTLDPLATGVLPLMVGKFTRLAQFFVESEKEYQGVMRLGFATTTYDAEGEPVPLPEGRSRQEFQHSPEKIQLATMFVLRQSTLADLYREVAEFVGEIDQVPPPFSAKKINGVPAYKKARRGESVTLPPKRVHVKKFEILEVGLDTITFRTTVSAGTYVRSLAHDIGLKLGVGAHLVELRRLRSGQFGLERAWTIEDVEGGGLKFSIDGTLWRKDQGSTFSRPAGAELFIHPRTILPDMPAVTASPDAVQKIRHGGSVNLPEFSKAKLVKIFADQHDLIAIGSRVAGTLFQPKLVLV